MSVSKNVRQVQNDSNNLRGSNAGAKPRSKREIARRTVGKAIGPVLETLEVRQLLSLAAGSPDTAFNTTGTIVTQVGTGFDQGQALAVETNGIVVVGGSANGQFGLAAYSPTGALLSTIATTIGTSSASQINQIVIDPQGRVVVAGTAADTGTGNDLVVARYTVSATGVLSLDTTFGTGGYTTTDVGNLHHSDIGNAVALQPMGAGYDILVAGATSSSAAPSPAVNTYHDTVERYTSAGVLDTAFGTSGFATTTGTGDMANALVVNTDGSFVLAGETGSTAETVTGSSTGTGLTRHSIGLGSNASLNAITLKSNGEYLVAGTADSNFLVAEIQAGGATLDSTFGTSGKTETAFTGNGAAANDIAVAANGKIVLAGYETAASGYDLFAVARYNANGISDAYFGSAGTTTTDFTGGTGSNVAGGVAIQPDGKVAAAGYADIGTNPPSFAVASYVADNAPTGSGSASLTAIDQNQTNAPGNPVSSLLTQLSAADVDGDTLGVAVTSVDDSNGTFQYSTDSGTTFTAIPTVSPASAFLLSAGNVIRFVPNAGYTGTANLSLKIWDMTQGTTGGTFNTTASAAANLNAFSDSTFTVSQTVQTLASTVYVDYRWTGDAQGQTVTDTHGNTHTFGIDAFSNIQDGVTYVASGGTVNIDSGQYNQSNITINRPVTIIGQSEAGVTVAPSLVDSHDDSAFGGNTASNAFIVQSSGVTIQTLTIDGNANTTLAGTQNFRAGVVTDTRTNAIYNNTVVNTVNVQNIYRRGLSFYDSNSAGDATGDVVENSTLNDVGTNGALQGDGYAILVIQTNATISNNTITDTTDGIGTNFSTQYPTYAPTLDITGNHISGLVADPVYGATGLLLSGLALDSTVTNNTIDTTGDGGVGDIGVIFEYGSDVRGTAVQFTENTITSDANDTGLFIDHRSFGVSSTFTPVNAVSDTYTHTGASNTSSVGVLISDNDGGSNDNSGGTVSNSSISGYATGVDVSNVTTGDLTQATITGNTITGPAGGTAILVSGTGASANISGNTTVGGTTTGIDLESGSTSSVTGNTFAGNALDLKVASGATLTALTTDAFTGTQYIDNESTQNIDATTDTFNVGTGGAQVGGNSLTNAQAYAVEDRITDAIDKTGVGLVRIKSGTVFVTPNSFAAPATTDTGAIQRGVNAASSGDTLDIESGTYTDTVTISKPLTIDGANVGVAGSSGSRGAETVVTPAAVQTAVFTVSGTANVKLDGLTIDGYNPALTGYALYSGDTTDVSYAVHTSGTVSGLTVQNDVVKRVFIGVRGDGLSTGNLITANDFDSIGNFDFGYAVSLRSDFYANVTNNVMTRVWTGIHLSSFHTAGGPATFTVSGNTIQDYAGGVMDWLQYGSATPLTLDNNQISVQSGQAPVANNFGLSIVSLQNTDSIAVTNDTFTGEDDGVVIFNASTSNPVTLGSTDTISGSKLAGIYETDNLAVNPIGTTNFLANGSGSAETVDLTGVAITGITGIGVLVDSSGGTATNLVATGQTIGGNAGTTGVEVFSALSTASLTGTAVSGFGTGIKVDNGTLGVGSGDTVTGGATGLILNGSSAAVSGLALNNLAFSGQTGNYVNLSSGAENGSTINATTVSFGGLTGATATTAQDYAIEDKISDVIDAPGVGFVRIKSGNVYVTALSETTTPGSIERAVTVASSGDTIHVTAGSFVGDIDLVNPVTLQGAQVGVSPTGTAPATGSQTIITSSQAQANDSSNAIVTVDANNVTIDGVTVDGSVPAAGSFTDSAYGSNVGSADGIGAYGTTSGLLVQNSIVQHTAISGLDLDNGTGTPTSGNVVRNNLIQDLGVTTGPSAGFGIGIYLGDNFYAAVTSNLVTNSFVGIQTGNFYLADPGAAGSISSNTVTAGAVGIFYNNMFEGSSDIAVANNAITARTDPNGEPWAGVLVASVQSGVNATFTGNTINGSSASDTTGQSSGYQFWNDPTTGTVAVSGGSVTGVDYGVWVNSYEGYASNGSSSAPSVSGLSITANKAGVYVEDSPQNGNHPAVSASIAGSTISAPVGVLVSGSAASVAVASTTIGDTTTGIEVDDGTLTVGSGDVVNGGVTGLVLNGLTTAVTGLTLSNLAFNGPSDNYITLAAGAENGSEINSTAVAFNGVVGNSATTVQAYAIEDKITDAIDETGVGFVRIKSGNVFVTPNSYVAPATNDTGAISRAVGVASDGDTVHIENGTYHETQVLINKGLTLVGDSEAGVIIDGGGESVTIANSAGLINVSGTTASEPVTIEALTVQNEGNSGGFDGTADVDAHGIAGALTIENVTAIGEDDYNNVDANLQIVDAGAVTIENNNLSNSSQGMLIEDALGAVTVTGNTVDKLIVTSPGAGTVYPPEGILLLEDSGNVNTNLVQINNNTLTGFRGFGIIAQGGYTYAGAGGLGGLQIENNTVAVAGDASPGILVSNGAGSPTDAANGGVTGATISGNTVTGDGTAGTDGIQINGFNTAISIAGNAVTNTDSGLQLTGDSTVGVPSVNVSGNTISASATAGIEVDAGSATITSGTVSTSPIGLSVTNGSVSVAGSTFTNDTTGVSLTGGTLTVGSGDVINGGTTGLLVSGSASTLTGLTLSNLAFNGPSGNYITLAAGAENGSEINATGASFNGVVGNSATTVQAYAIEDKITDAIDETGVGFVRIKSGNVFVTPNSYVAPATNDTGAISRAVGVASDGDTVHIETGTYHETQVLINKGLTLVGDSEAGVIIDGGGETNSINSSSGILHVTGTTAAQSVTIEDLTLQNAGTPSDQAASDTTSDITALHFNGPLAIENTTLVGESDPNAFDAGIVSVFSPTTAPITITGDTFTKMFQGILVEDATAPTTISGDTFTALVTGTYPDGNGGTTDYAAEGVFILNDSGTLQASPVTIDNNVFGGYRGYGVAVEGGYTYAGSGSSSDIQIENNTIGVAGGGAPGIGIYNGAGDHSAAATSGITSATISGNTITGDGTTGADGVDLYGQSSGISISGNTITSTDIGIDLDGDSKVGNPTATITGNTISQAATAGIEVDAGAGTVSGGTVTSSAAGLSVTGGTANVSGGSYTSDTVGLSASGGDLKAQGATITGDGTGVIVSGGATVDLGDVNNTNTTGLGSSSGGNNLSGYTGAGSNYAINDQNSVSQPNVLAENNNFGMVSSSNQAFIGTVIHDHADESSLSTVEYTPAANATTQPTTVYVSGSFAGDALGSDPDGVGPATSYGYDAFPDIADAIAAVATGGTVIVESGTYAGPVNVTKNLTLEGNGSNPVIQATPTMTSQFSTAQANTAVVYVAPGVTATVQNLTVDGNGDGNNYGDGFYGVAFYNSAGTLNNVTVKNVEQTPFNGVQGGVGVLADVTDGVARTVTLTSDTIETYQKNGTVFEGTGLTANMSGSTVTGAGTTGVIAQNGIEVARGAVGNITGNTVTGNSYNNNAVAASTGVILYQAGAGTTVSGNTIQGSDVGVYAISDAGNTTISNNDISGGASAGIVSDGGQATVTGNYLHNSAGDGVDLYDSENGSTVENNIIQNNAGDGVYIDSSVTDTTNPLVVKYNAITGNTVAGLEDGSTAVSVNADFNYWGSSTGPTAVNNPNGTGDAIVIDTGAAGVTFAPWLTSGTDTAPGTPGFQPTSAAAFGIYGSSTATEGAPYTINFTPSADITSYSVNFGDGTTGTYPSGTLSATHTYTEFGTFNVSSTAASTGGSVTSNTQTVTVGNASIVATATNITATEGIAFNGSVGSFTDAAGASSNPSDLSAVITWGDGATSTATLVETTPTSGVFTVDGTHTYAEYGSYTFSYKVTEAGTPAATFTSNTATATVGTATITATATNITATEGIAFNGSVGSFTDAAGASSNPADLSAVITWGDGATSTATLVETTPTSGVFTVDGAHTYAEYGSYTFSYKVTEAGSPAATFTSNTATATVGTATITPTATNITATEGIAFNGSVGSFTDAAGASSNPSDLSAVIHWGDGATSTATLVETTPTSGVFTVDGTHTYAEYGTDSIYYVVTEAGGPAATFTSNTATATVGTATITPTATNITATEGIAFNGSVGSFTDAAGASSNPSDLSAVITWGDGATSTATLVETTPTSGVFTVDGAHAYAEYGSYTFSYKLTEAGSPVATFTSNTATATVGTATITPTATNIAATEGIAFNGSVGSFTDAAGASSNPADLSAVIHWGDGATSTATLVETTPTSGVFAVDGTHTYAEYGTDSIYYVVTEAGTPAATFTSNTATATVGTATITATATNITATEGIAFNGSVGSFTDAAGASSNPSDLSAVITWGDGATSTATLVETTPTSGVFTVDGTHTYAEYGSYTFSYKVTEAGAPAATFTSNTATATVGTATITATATNITATEGIAFNGSVGSFTDAAGASSNPADLSAVITWGDGATSTATLVETTPTSGVFTVDGAHTYAEYGSYTFSYKVTEAGSPAATFTSNTATATVGTATITPTATNITATEGIAFNGSVGSFTDAAGASSNPSDLSAVIHWGDGATSTATLVETTPTSGVFTVDGTHTYAEYGTDSIYYVVTEAGGPAATFTSNTATATVGTATITPTATNITATEGIAFNGSVGSFTDAAGASSNPSDLSAVITWGDGATSTATLVETTPTSGVFTVDGAHAYAEYGSYTFSYKLTEAGSPVATFTSNTATATVGTATITPTATNIAATEGIAFNGSVGSFTDAAGASSNPSDLSAVIHWGDGATSTATLVETTPTSGVFTVDGTHTYAEYGTDSIYYVVTEAGTPAATFTSNTATATVSASSYTVAAYNVSATEGTALTNTIFGQITDTAGSFTNPSDLATTVSFGDGSTATATLVATATPGVYSVEASHTYAEYGSYVITVSVNQAGGSIESAQAAATVSAATITLTAKNISGSEGATLTDISVGTLVSGAGTYANPSDLSATINWGDGTATTTATLVESVSNPGTFDVEGTHTYGVYGTYTLTIVAVEKPSTTQTATSKATIGEVAPSSLNLTASPSTINEDTSTTLSGSFTAPGSDTHTVTINYGDGSTPVTLSLGAGVTSFTNAHTYVNNISTNTTYTVSVTVTDSTNASTSGTTSVTVDYGSPTVALSGSKTDPSNSTPNDAAGSTFTLTLAPVNDPGYAGGNRVQDYYINWGDGSATQVVPASSLNETTGGTVTHVYQTGTVPQGTTAPNYTVHVDILDSNGYHTDAGTLGVVVYDVPPTATFSGSGSVSAGAAGNVVFFNQYDPSTTDSAAGYTYSYDFGNTGTFEITNSTSPSASVPASDLTTPGNYTVRGRIIDQYGEYTDYLHTITVTDVNPTVNTLSNVTVGQGVAFTEMGSFTDPANTAPFSVYVNYNYNASSSPGRGTLVQSGSTKTFTLGNTYNTPGTYTVLVTVVDNQGATGTGSFTVTVGSTNFAVTSLTPNPSGFDVTFNRALNTSALNLYSGLSGTYGTPDLTLTGPNGTVHGSFVYDPTTNTGHFVATGGVLPAGTYSASLVGSSSAFKDNAGNPLSSNDGTGNYDTSFTEASPGDVVSAPDFARGPGQTVNLPATGTTGIPISISNGASVTAVDFTLIYNPNDLTINSVSLPASLQSAGFSYAINNNTPGNLQLSIYGTNSMPSGAQTVIYLNASVPSSAVYGNAAVLQISALRINEGNIAGTADEAVEKVAFIGDASGNKGYSAYDSSLIANVVVHNASGFDAFPLVDPVIVGDVSGDGTLSGLDASMVAQESVGYTVPQIPPIPAGTVTTAPQTGLDPTVTIGSIPLANPGTTITIPVSISDTTGLLGANFSIGFNALQLQFVSATVGSADSNFTVYTNANNSTGTLQLGLSDNTTALGAGSGTIAYITFTVPSAAPSGSNAVTLAGADGGLNEGGLALTTVNGTVNIQSVSVGAESVFYNASTKYDSKSGTTIASLADFNAIATDKTALQPGGTATFANYTSYSLGLNGILVDFVNMAAGATFSAGDFTFKVGNNNTPSSWATAPAPVSVTAITGPNGDTYADLIWANNAIQNQYLQVTILSDSDTGLATPVTFYYGNAIGETGNSATDAVVNATDVSLAQSHQSGFTVAAITNVYDFNRDGTVNATDVSIAQSHQSGFTPLKLITVPGTTPSGSAAPGAQAAGAAQPAGVAQPAPAAVPAIPAVPNVPALPAGGGAAVAAPVAPLVAANLAAAVPPAPVVVPAKPAKNADSTDGLTNPLVLPSVVPSVSPVVTLPFTSSGASIQRDAIQSPAGLRSLASTVLDQPAAVVPSTLQADPVSSPFSQVPISAIYQQLNTVTGSDLFDSGSELLS